MSLAVAQQSLSSTPSRPLEGVVIDKADKTGDTYAVIWKGELLPIRFDFPDAVDHLLALRGSAG